MSIEAISDYCFGAKGDDTVVAKQKAVLCWCKNPATDEEIRHRFEEWMTKASTDELAEWQLTPSGLLALILLTDQFSRNIYRDSPKAFAQDAKALARSLEGVRRGFDLKLRPIERVFSTCRWNTPNRSFIRSGPSSFFAN